jgi:hypothetical protein
MVRTERVLIAVAVTCILGLQGCGDLTVSPAGPSTTVESVKGGQPTLLNFQGQLADGGSFKGYVIYGSKDIEGRPQFGRFQAAYWDVVVTGGTRTRDARFTHTNQGRALVETYTAPQPTIGLVFLWPDHDPELQQLSPHFRASSSYNPDLPPTMSDFGELLRTSGTDTFGFFQDGQGSTSFITAASIEPALQPPGERTSLP